MVLFKLSMYTGVHSFTSEKIIYSYIYFTLLPPSSYSRSLGIVCQRVIPQSFLFSCELKVVTSHRRKGKGVEMSFPLIISCKVLTLVITADEELLLAISRRLLTINRFLCVVRFVKHFTYRE